MNWLVIPFLTLTAYASDQVPDVDMHAMTKGFQKLQKVLFSPGAFGSAQNEDEIRGLVAELRKHVGHLQEKVFADQPALRTNTRLLAGQLSDADRAFRAGDKALARYELTSSLQLCISCHTRGAASEIVLPPAELTGATDAEKADYYFATRQFDAGRQLFESLLAAAKTGEARPFALPLAVYYARIKEDPAGGQALFSKAAAGKARSPAERKELSAWAAEFASWRKEKKAEPVTLNEAELLDKAKALLARKKAGLVTKLRASSYLHAVLETPKEKTPAKAAALRELGAIYDGLDSPLYFRFGELYLEDCIDEYAPSPEAKACYRALETAVTRRPGGGAEEVELLKWKRKAAADK